MGYSSRVEVFIETEQGEESLGKLLVPDVVTPDDIRKSVRVAVTITVNVGGRRRRKTVTVPVYDPELRRLLVEYLSQVKVRVVEVVSEEKREEVYPLQDIRDE